ncbi:MAG: tetratricopeptide repeat protein [Pseudohongiella sp.]|uniref:tetratricopeptide repeat protein n=1 Tax=Pseudohongiella sp. TaxID=1979412 RepID=UPI0034A09514
MCFRSIAELPSGKITINPLPTFALAISLCWATGQVAADAAGPDQARVAELAIPALRESIQALEGRGDTWHPQIAESVLSLARHVQEAGDHPEAIALLERAVHVSRVNHGLFSLEQVSALEMQIDSHLALDQWAEADGLRQYLFYVHSRALDDNDPALIPALEAYAQWNIRAFWQRLGELPASRLVDAYHLYSVALSIIDQDAELTEQSREDMLERLAYLAWLMARTDAQGRQHAQHTNIRLVDDNWVDQVTGRRYRNHNNPFLQGEYALDQIVEMRAQRLAAADAAGVTDEARDDLLVAHTNAILDLADWYLLFERRNASIDVYERAWASLQDEDKALRDRVFDRVVMLPRFETTRQPDADPVPYREPVTTVADVPPVGTASVDEDAPGVPYVVMEFDINQYGRAINVDIVDSWPKEDFGMQRRLIGALRDSRMRPIMRDGSASRVEDLVYRFPYEIESTSSEAQ